jgi:hypothetical protein
MKMLSQAFLLSLVIILTTSLAAPSTYAQQTTPGSQPAPPSRQPAPGPQAALLQLQAFPPQGSLKLDRNPLPLQEGPGYFKSFPPARPLLSADARNLLLQAFATPNLRIMSPDNMPCVVPNTARLEKMPTRRNASPLDRMPIDPGAVRLGQRP